MAKKSDKFLYVGKKGRIKIRFVGEQVEMFQYFNKNYFNGVMPPFSSSSSSFGAALATNPLLNSSGKPSFFREDDNGDAAYSRSKRIVSLVVDRADEKVKAFACPISVWNMMTDHAKENDFEIWKEGAGLQTRYHTEPLGITDITEDQAAIVEATLDSFTFVDIFVNNEWEILDEIVERIENRWDILDL